MKPSKKQEALTLVEMLVVIGIICIIVAVSFPMFWSSVPTSSTINQAPAKSPEKSTHSYHVTTVPLSGFSTPSGRIHNALVGWLKANPTHKIVSIVYPSGDVNIVIVSETK